MSLALDFLREYLTKPDYTQADFARACGMTAPNVSDLIKGDVQISRRNMAKILHGFRTKEDRVNFLTAYLRDEIPTEHADDIIIQVGSAADSYLVGEAQPGEELEEVLLAAFRALPSDSYRQRVVTLIRALRGDAKLRELFKSTVDYLQPPEAEEAAKSTAADIHAAAKATLAAKDQPPRSSPVQYKQPRTPRSPKRAAPPKGDS